MTAVEGGGFEVLLLLFDGECANGVSTAVRIFCAVVGPGPAAWGAGTSSLVCTQLYAQLLLK
jgi:hypothetical protein